MDKGEAWRRYSEHYAATSGQLYLSDSHQTAEYLDGYHAWLDAHTGSPHRGSEMITELYVPRDRLAASSPTPPPTCASTAWTSSTGRCD